MSRSRSTGPSFISAYVSSLSRNEDTHTKMAKRICYRASSSSPTAHRRLTQERKNSHSPVAFGRGISKERAFAVEKKKVEEKLSKISKDLHVSTRILRNPSLRSPNEVKQAVQNTFKPIAYVKDPKLASLMVKKSLESQAYQSTTATTMRNYASKINEQKSLKVTVAISSRGREIMRTSTETPPRSLRSHPSNVSTLSSKSSTLTKASDSTIRNGSKLKVSKSKNSIITSSNNSLARTNSTYSIDSNLSVLKKKSSSSAKSVPLTIMSQKLKKSSSSSSSLKREKPKSSFQAPTMDDNRKVVEGADENASQSNEAMKSSTFFQQLFLKDNLKKYGAAINPNSSVIEKARMWNALATYKSEPSLRQPNYYLHQSRPVSRSRFLRRAYEKRNESECYAIFNSTGASGGGEVPLKAGFVMEQIYKYDSLYQLSDEDEFGNSNRGRSLDFSLSYHERSNSEPPSKTVMTEVVRPYSPLIIYGRNKSVETTAEKRQRNSRSPSCRRIQSLKTNKLTELSSYQKEIVRAQSVGRTDRAKERLQSQSEANLYRSKSLNILNIEKHLPICGHKKNERFRDLRDFYACLERVGQLERATSHSDLRPRRRNEEIIDYDLWQKVREHEKNERELNILLKKLRVEQRDKDFLFQPHTADEYRWSADNDFGLVTKEKSVENLKEVFRTSDEGGTDENSEASQSGKRKGRRGKKKKEPFDGSKDNYKPLWRASSVLDLASNMTQKYNKVKAAIKSTLPKGKEGKHDKNFGLSRKLLSTLSKDQLKKIRSQLTEIYSTTNDVKSAGTASSIEQFVVTVPPIESQSQKLHSNKPFLTVRSHSELTKDRIQEPTVDISSLKNVFESKSSSTVAASEISESEKRSISHSLCQEIKDKFNKKKAVNPDIERVKKIESAINIKAPSATKPSQPIKRDISFTFQEAPPAAAKYLADCLPVKKAESISSETSNRTVIFRDNSTTMDDVHDKIKYFEEIEKEKEKVPTTIYHACDDSSLDEEENEKKVAEAAANQKQPTQQPSMPDKDKAVTAVPKLTTSQSYTDFKDLFGERSSLKSNTAFRGSHDENFGESRLMKRSRSSSPNDSERGYKSLNEFGDVEKLKMKFEKNFGVSGDDYDSYQQLIFSDSELNRATITTKKTRIRGHEHGNVSHIAHKYEMQSKRARSRTRRISPIPKNSIKRDRLMPHINVISKTASLKEQKRRISTSNKDNLDKIEPIPSTSGEVVAKIKEKFESLSSNLSLMGKMFTSTPEIRELNDISPHLSHLPHCGNFVSHRYPRPEDNNRSIISPDKSPSRGIKPPRKRPSSTSPIRKEMNVTKQLREIFSDDHHSFSSYDSRRYLPDRQLEAEYLWQKKQQQLKSSTSYSHKGHWQ